ncbi:SPASM domain-containing protein [Geobacillus icigianus]
MGSAICPPPGDENPASVRHFHGKEESILYHEELPTFGCDINSFSYLGIYHPCLTGSLAITSDKKVVPCPRLESEVLMDLKEHNSLLDLFDRKEKVLKYWKLSLENIEPCGTCEFKRMCMDCRAAEVAFSNSLNQKSLCSYRGL